MVPKLLPNFLDVGGESGKSLPWRMGREVAESNSFHQAKKWANALGLKKSPVVLFESFSFGSILFKGETLETEKWIQSDLKPSYESVGCPAALSSRALASGDRNMTC